MPTTFVSDAFASLPQGASVPAWLRREYENAQEVEPNLPTQPTLTPDFVADLLLDLTLAPAMREFGLSVDSGHQFRLIDASCGVGCILVRAFDRILAQWKKQESETPIEELVQRTLESIHGVDTSPHAVAITRFRLLVAATKACDLAGHDIVPEFVFSLAAEDTEAASRMLRGSAYHCVATNSSRIEQSFALTVKGEPEGHCAGYIGQITRCDRGSESVQSLLSTADLTHVIDASGAYIPGQPAPAVILVGRNRQPTKHTVRTVTCKRSEPSLPDDPAQGKVWSAIVAQLDQPGSRGEYVNVDDLPRDIFIPISPPTADELLREAKDRARPYE